MPSLSAPPDAHTAKGKTTIGFLNVPEVTAEAQQSFDEDVADRGQTLDVGP